MDRGRLTVIIALLGVISVGIAALVASLVVPYNVTFGALVLDVRGEGTYARNGQSPAPLPQSATVALPVGSTIQLKPESRATLHLEMNGGRVTLTGPATLTLLASYRRATSLGHLLKSARFTREYVLVFSQTQGTAYYDFSATAPRFEKLSVTVELPQERYTPTRPCWEIAVQPDGTAQAESTSCR